MWVSNDCGCRAKSVGENHIDINAKKLKNDFTIVELLKACAKTKNLHEGKKLHNESLRRRLHEKNSYVASALISMYAKCGMLAMAQQVLEELLTRDVVPWTALIAGYANEGKDHEALGCFSCMRKEGVTPNEVTFVCILKACTNVQAVDKVNKGQSIHVEMISNGMLEKHIMLGNALVHMYAKGHALSKAQQVLRGLPFRNEVSWSVLISGYIQEKQYHEALSCFTQMLREGLSPNAATFIHILKACSKIGDFEKAQRIHDEIVSRGLFEKNIAVGNTLVSMYAKCGMLAKALQVLEDLPVRDEVSWNALIAGCVQYDQGHKALPCLTLMQTEGLSPNEVTFTCSLKACSSIGDINKGKQIHNEIISRRLQIETNVMLGTALVDMYAKFGMLTKAHQVFEELSFRNIITWNALITGYLQHGQADQALNCFQRMDSEGFSPDVVTFTCALNACGSIVAIDMGREVHNEVINKDLLKKSIMLGNASIHMYAKCGMLEKAHQVLKELPTRDVVSWTSLIAGYAQKGEGKKALECFDEMQMEGISPNAFTFTCILRACGSLGSLLKGGQIHDNVLRKQFLEKNIMLGNALVDMYAKCGVPIKAQEVLENLPIRNSASWNALIAGYAQQEQCHEAIRCASQMQTEGHFLDEFTLTSILKSCGCIGYIEKGKQIHNEIVGRHSCKENVVLGTALVDMYAKCGVLDRAQQVLDELPVRNVVTWNTIIAGYICQGQFHDALDCFEQLQEDGLTPDEVTFAAILRACGSTGAINMGKQIHDDIVNRGLLDRRTEVLGNALVEMYARCGAFLSAQQALEEFTVQNLASWNSLIVGFVEHEQSHEALNCFGLMQSMGIRPNETTFVSALKACGAIGALEKGKQISDEIVQCGLLEESIVAGNALVDMYAKCGLPTKAQEVLQELPVRNVATWNALIAGYMQDGQGCEALNCFLKMEKDLVAPNEVTLLHILKACGQLGKLGEAKSCYENITRKYGIAPKLEHHTCMVSAFASAGYFGKAMQLVKMIPCFYNPLVWLALLGACRKWGNVKLGRLAFEQVIQFDCDHGAPYMLMANIYSGAGMRKDAQKLEAMRMKNGF